MGRANLRSAGEGRRAYIDALHLADEHDLESLLRFARAPNFTIAHEFRPAALPPATRLLLTADPFPALAEIRKKLAHGDPFSGLDPKR